MPQASDAGHGVQGLLFGLLGFGLAVVQSSLVFPVFSFGLGMLFVLLFGRLWLEKP